MFSTKSKVHSIMTMDVITSQKEQSLMSLDRIMRSREVHCVPVIEDCKLIGIVCKSDFQLFKRGYHDYEEDAKVNAYRLKAYKVEDIMQEDIITLDIDDEILDAINTFCKYNIRSIPVIDGQKLVGIVSMVDVINKFFGESQIN